MDDTHALLASLVQTKPIERVLAPIANQVKYKTDQFAQVRAPASCSELSLFCQNMQSS